MSSDTPNPFVAKQFSPEASKKMSEEIHKLSGQNTREEMDRRLGKPENSIICPHCGKPL